MKERVVIKCIDPEQGEIVTPEMIREEEITDLRIRVMLVFF